MSEAIAIDHRGEGEIVEAFAISGGKWTILVIRRLGDGKQRFNDCAASCPASLRKP